MKKLLAVVLLSFYLPQAALANPINKFPQINMMCEQQANDFGNRIAPLVGANTAYDKVMAHLGICQFGAEDGYNHDTKRQKETLRMLKNNAAKASGVNGMIKENMIVAYNFGYSLGLNIRGKK